MYYRKMVRPVGHLPVLYEEARSEILGFPRRVVKTRMNSSA
jgi:hypothetical protein